MWNVIVLGLTSLCTDIASEMVYPLVPFFLTATLGASPAILGLIEGAAESVASLLKVFSGRISDTLHRRKELAVAGYASSAIGKLLLAVAGGWGMVFAGRVVDRFGKGIRTAPRDALIAESTGADSRGMAFGLHRAMDTAGAVGGVVIAYAYLSSGNARFSSVFFWSLLPASLGVILLLLVREARSTAPRNATPVFRWHALPSRLKLFLGVSLVFTLGNSSNAFLLLRAQNAGFTPSTVLLLYLVYNIVFSLASTPAGALSDRVGRKPLLLAGYGCYAAVYAGFGLAGGAFPGYSLWALFGLYGIYSSFTEGLEKALVADLAPFGVRATAIGLHATVVGIGLLPASLIAGELWACIGPAAPFFFGSAMGIAGMIGLLLVL